MKVVIITPVRNEAEYIGTTIKCMIRQKIKPIEWIIVDDGSTDGTKEIVESVINEFNFIRLLKKHNRGYRKPAIGVIESFNFGLSKLKNKNYNIIAKFDSDLMFPSDMIEKIVKEFKNNPKLGITGGTRYEQIKTGGPLKKVLVHKGFVGGPFKFYRKQCFYDINGLIKRAGWDGVDAIRANINGWETGEIESLKIIHLKPTGLSKGEGLKNSCQKYGDVSYYMGGFFWYFLLRIVGRSLIRMNPLVGIYMLKGYFSSYISKLPREDNNFRRYLKKKQIDNIKNWLNYYSNKKHSSIFKL